MTETPAPVLVDRTSYLCPNCRLTFETESACREHIDEWCDPMQEKLDALIGMAVVYTFMDADERCLLVGRVTGKDARYGTASALFAKVDPSWSVHPCVIGLGKDYADPPDVRVVEPSEAEEVFMRAISEMADRLAVECLGISKEVLS